MNTKNVPAVPALFKYFPNFGARTVGFDHLFDMMDRISADVPNYPPYNISKFGDDSYKIEIAAAGFDKEEITIEYIKNDLVVKASSKEQEGSDQVSYIHRGLAMRDFVLKFKIADDVEVKEAKFENGLLIIDLKAIVPDEGKPKQIPII